MLLCSKGHEEIVHEFGYCPLCDKIEFLKEAEEKSDRLDARVEELLEELNDKVHELKLKEKE